MTIHFGNYGCLAIGKRDREYEPTFGVNIFSHLVIVGMYVALGDCVYGWDIYLWPKRHRELRKMATGQE